MFDNAALLYSAGGRKPFRSLPSFTKWLLSTFQVIYLIEAEKSVLGFIGLYGMKPGQSLKLSMAIFSPDDRGKGHGTSALELLLPWLQEKGLAEEVYAEVAQTNARSLPFLKRAGFEIRDQKGDVILLSKKLTPGSAS